MTQLHTQEHVDMVLMFERIFRGEGRFDKEDKAMWPKGYIYQDANLNRLFLAFRQGAAYGRAL